MAPLVAGLAVLGGIGSFGTVRDLAVPWFGALAWIVPVGINLGILALLAWDLLLEYTDMAWPVLRWVAWCFVGATVALNAAAAHGHTGAMVMHAAMPVLFVTVLEGVRHLIRRWVGLTVQTRRQRVPLARWLLSPWSSLTLWRRMILWDVTAYSRGLHLEHLHLREVARLQEIHGRWMWRWRAPLSERIALRLQAAEAAFSGDAPTQDRGEQLVHAAQAILAEAEQSGVRLSQMDLAAQLRAQGYRIANERLRWLASAVGLRREAA
ncbi:hypothetical protein Ssi02_77740 [Sinosporangium siamense]|uniref:DUF2637 domain-containing protein n=1 Tax=Sinosporangium siamense TaxID=1367973 RepID=A0A919RPM5_9ACTN|nr:hypothetical protein Ssi02_77740 [Sinosporangium siamense]